MVFSKIESIQAWTSFLAFFVGIISVTKGSEAIGHCIWFTPSSALNDATAVVQSDNLSLISLRRSSTAALFVVLCTRVNGRCLISNSGCLSHSSDTSPAIVCDFTEFCFSNLALHLTPVKTYPVEYCRSGFQSGRKCGDTLRFLTSILSVSQ